MHDHSEPSQTAQGGNYNCGMISGMNAYGRPEHPRHYPGLRRAFAFDHHLPRRTDRARPEQHRPGVRTHGDRAYQGGNRSPETPGFRISAAPGTIA